MLTGKQMIAGMAAIMIACAAAARAADFDLRAAAVENLDGGQSMQLTVDGITATVQTVVGVLNQEDGGFGATTGTDNDGDFLVNGQDAILIDFDTDVVWGGLPLRRRPNSNAGRSVSTTSTR